MFEENIIIENMLLHPQHIETVADWVHKEFGNGNSGRTLDYVITRFNSIADKLINSNI